MKHKSKRITKKNQVLRSLSMVPAICIMIAIFYFSSQTAVESSSLSGGITENIYQFVSKIGIIDNSDKYAWLEYLETIIRKVAHMTEYAILGIAVSFSLFVYGNRRGKLVLLNVMICVFYALTDEIHQLYVAGRSGQLLDVAIDGCGALIGCFVFLLIGRLFKK